MAWGLIAAAGLGAVGSLVGGLMSAKAGRKARKQTKQRLRENEDWYNRRYNEDATQRADAQLLLTRTEEAIRDRNRAAAGRQAVVGGTDESVAATRAANSAAIADTNAQIAAQGEQRKDRIEQQYMERRDSLEDKLQGQDLQRSQNVATATGNLLTTAGSIAAALDSGAGENTNKTSDTKTTDTNV